MHVSSSIQHRALQVLAQDNFLAVVPEVLKDSALQAEHRLFAYQQL